MDSFFSLDSNLTHTRNREYYVTHPYPSGYNSFNYQVEPYHPPNYPIHAYHVRYGLKIVRFDDAPDPVYGIALRSRRFFTCDGASQQECDDLEAKGDVVDCKQPRFRFVNICL